MALFFGLSVQARAAKLDFPADFVLGGYDVVSYFQESGPVMGTREFTMFYDGAFYAFRNAENAEEFRVNTKQYLPAYEANCAFGMVHGMKSSVDPLIWEKVDGRLFFLINAGTRKRWKKRAPGYIEKSDRVWSKLFEE